MMKEPASLAADAAERSDRLTLPLGRKLLYATVATVLSLVLFLVGAELTLTLAGYGHAAVSYTHLTLPTILLV